MSESSGRPTSYGLSILDIATDNVLRRFEMEDWEGSLIRQRILATVAGDKELIALVKKYMSDIADYRVQFRARNKGITVAENLSSDTQLRIYMQDKALDLFEQLMLKMKEKKLTIQSIEPRYGEEGKL